MQARCDTAGCTLGRTMVTAAGRKTTRCSDQEGVDAHPGDTRDAGKYGEPLFVGMDPADNAATNVGCGASHTHGAHATIFERMLAPVATVLGVFTFRD